MRVVIIDDDDDTHDFLIPYLKSEGFDTYSAYSGRTGLELVHSKDPDVIVLDVQLPQDDGWEICRSIRSFSSVPILMISAVAQDDDDVIRGLSLGADDYLLKPLRLNVFGARLRALLRRSTSPAWPANTLAYVDHRLMIDLYRRQVYVQGTRISLSSLEFRLLELLVSSRNQVVPTLEIVENLWSDETDLEYMRYVRVYIRRLREALEPDPRHPQYIITEHGLGYQFVTPT